MWWDGRGLERGAGLVIADSGGRGAGDRPEADRTEKAGPRARSFCRTGSKSSPERPYKPLNCTGISVCLGGLFWATCCNS